MAVCTKCGTESEGQFCTNCGASMTAPDQNTTPAQEPAAMQSLSAPPQNPAPMQNISGPPQNYQNPAPNYQNPAPNYQNPAPNYQAPPPYYSSAPVVMPRHITSPGGWIGWMILMSILPLIAQLIMLSSSDESVKNFAKAQLYLMLLCVALFIVAIVVFIALGALNS